MKHLVCALALAFSLSGCAGYHIGYVKPSVLRDVETIAVPMFRNSTYQPRLEALVTNTVIKQLQQDGTFTITAPAKADAVLEGVITGVSRRPVRSVGGNVLATAEFNLGVSVLYTLRKKDGTAVMGPATVIGETSFFVRSDVNSEERQALPLAAEDLAVRLASQLTEGW